MTRLDKDQKIDSVISCGSPVFLLSNGWDGNLGFRFQTVLTGPGENAVANRIYRAWGNRDYLFKRLNFMKLCLQ